MPVHPCANFPGPDIAGDPINPATNALIGRSYNCSGVRIYSIPQSRNTTMRSAIVIASSDDFKQGIVPREIKDKHDLIAQREIYLSV
jgi:hypothetical protein